MREFFHSSDFTHLLVSVIVAILSFTLWSAVQQVYKRAIPASGFKGERATVVRVTMDVLRFALMSGTILLILQVNGVNVSSAVLYKVRFFCPPETRPDRTRDALREVQNGLREAGLQIPYSQCDVHLVTGPAAADRTTEKLA